MALPDPGATMHVAGVNYAVTFAELVSGTAPIRFSAPGATSYIFEFDTGQTQNQDGSFTVTWDQSWFSQATAEAAIASSLDGTCANIATMLGLTQAQVQAAVTVRRLWTLNQNSYAVIAGVSSGPQKVIIPDVMQYPATVQASASLTGAGSDAGSGG